jgi:signal transduction histidine kinase
MSSAMSGAVSADPIARRSTAAPLLTGRRQRVAVAFVGVTAGLGALALVATSDHLLHPEAYGIVIANVVIGSVGVALYWAARRPGNRIALSLLALSAAAAGIGLQGASSPLLHSVGVLFDPVVFVLGYIVVFSFPDGRVSRPLERLLVVAMAIVVLVGFLPWFFFSPVVAGGNPLAGCNAACPHNALMIADRPGIAVGVGKAEEYATVAVAAAIVLALAYRLVSTTRPRVRASIPVYVPAFLLTIPFTLFHAYGAGWIQLSADDVWTLGWFVNAGRATLVYGLVFAILQADLAAGFVLKRMMARLSPNANAAELRTLMADALDDPSLELAFRVGRSHTYLDSRTEPIVPTYASTRDRSATPVERNGEPVAYIVHDAALGADPELLHAAGQALLLALEGGRLEQELRSKTAELLASKAEVIAAGEAERRRIEQDLHDGAQQHLIALRVKVELARELAAEDASLAAKLGDLGEELEDVLHELRALAQGGYPPLLREGGLEEALATVALRSPQCVDLEARGVGRYPREVESAVYFCCLEGLQNVAKHAGGDARATVRIWPDNGRLWFEISDDGAGCEPEASRGNGNGLANMSDRVGPFGGTLVVDSSPGAGTSVRGSVSTAESRLR